MEPILEKVRDFADRAHGDQMRKYAADRYIVHPVRVMETCRAYDGRLPVLAAALLHDVLEDTPVTRAELLDFLSGIFPPADAEWTLRLVEELTDVFIKQDYPQLNRRERKRREERRLATVSAEAQTIKYADILDNTSEIAANDPDFAPRFLRECQSILREAGKGHPELRKIAMERIENELPRAGLPAKRRNPARKSP